uniref:Zinc finger homeobox 3 n=1 Tax=Neogobius melanostomus TaxID=47308 RepID=A0A8C6T0P1_9GOBI
MDSCESPVVSGTDNGLGSSQQQKPPQPWKDHSSSQVPCTNQAPSLDPLSIPSSYSSLGSSDVENLAGEIVYQPDGSAYIVESLSQLIQSGGGMVPSLLPTNSHSSGGKAGEPAGTVYPQIINTFHIASSFGKWFGNSDQGFPNTSTMAGLSPVLHSFRVFDVRHKSNKDYLNSDGSAKKSCVSKDVPNNVDFSKFDGLALYGKGKPILMCFLCKLSFGYARSFATHAVHDHRMTLCEEERRLLGDKQASAIIQGIGKDKEPLISFLEPKNKSTSLPPSLLPVNSGQSFYGTFSGVHLEPGSSSAGSEDILNKDSESDLEQQQQTALSSVLSLGGGGEWLSSAPSPHAPPSSSPPPLFISQPLPRPRRGPCDLSALSECSQNHGSGASGASGVECPKCDTVLGSSRSLGGHMTMMHSRNSCKTLKCPKCNWHYKYQQTLEAHMKEKHPDSGGSCAYCSSGQSHPRLARGESYTCGYKPFRCEVCNYSTTTKGNLSIHMQSDKHLNNMQTLQNGGTIGSGQEQVFGHAPGGCGAPSPTKLKNKPTWRCEVCDYETNVARNLRIHMTSEKHMHNMMLLQQNVTQMQHGRLGLGAMPSPSEAELYQYYLTQNMSLPPGLKIDPAGAEAQFLMGGFHLDPNMAALAPALGNLSQTSDPSLKLFQCAVCNRFTTDNLEVLGMHMGTERSLPEEEWRAVVGDSHQCKLCHYTTQLKANFQLHCKTDKHVQKYQLVAHIKEGGKGNEWRLKCVAIGNPVHLKCNACDYYTNSLEKLRMHTVNSRHEASLRLYKHLQQHENAVEGDACYYHCVLCNYSTKAKLNLIQHVRSMKHQRSESLRKLQRLQKGLPEEEEDLSSIFTIRKCPSSDTELSEDVEAASETTTDQEDQTKERESGGTRSSPKGQVRPTFNTPFLGDALHSVCILPCFALPQMYQCPYCKFTNTDLNRLRMHVMTQHSVQPMLRCPLCQDMLNNKVHLQFHLTHLHSVSPDCVEKLVASVSPAYTTENGSLKKCHLVSILVCKYDATGFLCWKKGCNQVFKSSNSLQIHFNEVHNKRPQLPVSDRHVYKYRCNQCSLAFKTVEKLQLHSQYHVIRAATMCCLCQRSFRTLQALKKHLETSHLELSEADIQQLYGGLLMNGDLMVMSDLALGEDPSMLGEDDKEGEESDPEEKQSPTGSDTGSLQEDCGSEPKRALPFRKGPNFTMEKFLDPSRPFKCTVCKESFTQKNILLVHYNSVSHLHKVKRALQESTTGQPEPTSSPDNKPFKCSTCNVAYSQSSTLEIHMRSVLHQTKARAAKLEAAGGIPSTTSASNLTGGRSKLSDLMSARSQQQQLQQQQQQLAQAQAQAQAQLQQELQQQAAILQSQLFNPALLQHFPMTTDALLPLQQQQLLFPFYIPGAEFQLNPEISLGASALGLTGSTSSLLEDIKNSAQQSCLQQQLMHHHHQQQQQSQAQGQMALLQQSASLLQQFESKQKASSSQNDKDRDAQRDKDTSEKKEDHANRDSVDNKMKEKKDIQNIALNMNHDTGLPPPRIASDARGNATKALLENFGFELVIQYNENKQKVQKKPAGATGTKLECEVCGKLFSNILILKSHQEHIHQFFFPFRSLERFAKEYREHYDKLYPLRPSTPEPAAAPAPPPPPPPPPPPQRAPTPNIPVSSASLTPPTVPPSQPQVSMAQISMPMDLPLFSPLMMQSMSLQSLPTQLQPQLSSMEPSLASDLAQLYQQQLTPAMLQAQQNKRPRTRITDDQLRVLRQYFDINNSPNEDQIKEMHWFRNTLFKERQRNKDSPYNFNNPPTTTLEDTKIDSKPPSPEPMKHDMYGSKRSSRTRFTDYQLRVLQDFFDANAYPKDDEFEQLSNLLSLPTRVIVVWFQNARQKARKNYENQGEGAKEGERRELSNDRYIRTTNLNYQCKKCNLVFQRIFDLIKHQKKLCYKDEDEDGQYDSHNEDSMELSHDCYTPSGSSCHTPMPSSSSLCPLPPNNSPQPETHHRTQRDEKIQNLSKSMKHSSLSFSQQQAQCGPSGSQTSQAPSQSSHMGQNAHLTSATQQLAQHMIPYQCEQCKIAFPSFEHWQEHQQLHFLSVQNQFIHPQFLDRPIDMPFMLFDPSNPLLASQLLSGAMPQIPSSSATSPSTPTSTMNSLKRKLEEKAGTSPGENDSTNSGEEPQRDKRLRTTITPEQLEILYQKYLLDSNPTRKMLDHIAHEVGLKKRVVQVWFQNTRARERKGQFRAVGPAQAHRRCPFCRALFKAKTALEAHIRSRHWHEAKRAGYNLALAGMLPDQDGMPKMDVLDMSHFSQMISANNEGQSASMSPLNKGLDLSPRALLSPSSIKVEGMEDFENATMSSVNLSFDHSKLDNDDCSSVNTAITDTTTGDEANADNDSADAKHGHNSNDYLSKSGGSIPLLENDDHMSSGLVSPATSYYAKDYENEHIIDHSETSSLADPCSPSPGASGSRSLDGSDRPGQKRFRTQMTNLQLKVLKSCFNDYRTPTMLECEVLGNDIGLPKRVVQVWFQNARAKEKKAKLNMAKHFGINQTSYEGPKTECTLCGVKYSARLSVRDHIFSQQHIAKVKDTIGSQIDKEKEYFDPATVRQLMAQQEMDRIKKANEVLGLAQQQAMQQQGMFDNPAMQALNLQSAYPNLQGIPPVLLPGVGSPSLSSFNSSNSALTPPKPSNLLNMPGASVPSPSLPTSGLPNKTPSSSSLTSSTSAKKEKPDTAVPATSMPTPGMEYVVDPAQLQALQAALATDPTALLTNQFLPYFMPGFSPYYTPQIPGALQGGYLQPMYGMESLFPYNPALSQALMGLSPGSLLQHYQQYQQSLQEALQQQQRQLQQIQQPRTSQTPNTSQTVGKDSAKEPMKSEEQKSSEPQNSSSSAPHNKALSEHNEVDGKAVEPSLDKFIVPKVQYKLACRKCQAVFNKEEAAVAHIKSNCFFGQPVSNLQEMFLRVPGGTGSGVGGLYDCLACDTTLDGEKALSQHLESALHKHRTIKRSVRNAKEHVTSLLPHSSACFPSPNTASTSQSVTHPISSTPPTTSAMSSSPPNASPSSSFPPVSSPSTVTSSSLSTSGVQTSIPTDGFSDESDSDNSQKSLDRLGRPLVTKNVNDSGLFSHINMLVFIVFLSFC